MTKLGLALMLVFMFAGVLWSAEFSYEIKMFDVDVVTGARKYPGDRASVIGTGPSWTAEKRLPALIGPGPVRVYIRVNPEICAKTYTISIGKDSAAITIDPAKGYTYKHIAEINLNMTEASDVVKFMSQNADGRSARSIWYSSFITNDPCWKYYMMKTPKTEIRYAIRYEPQIKINELGNLVPNSGFEAGLEYWTANDYRSNSAIKPLLLHSGGSAHGNYSLNAGMQKIQSDWIQLQPGSQYTFSFYYLNPPATVIEYETTDCKTSPVLSFKPDKSQSVWTRAAKTFTLPDATTTTGRVRICFLPPEDGRETLVDSVQLVTGEKLTDYVPLAGINAGLISTVFQGICETGSRLEAIFNSYAAPGVVVGDCTFTAYDYFDREVWKKQLKPGDTLVLPTDRIGFFRVIGRINYSQDGTERTQFNEFRYNVVYPFKPLVGPEISIFGAYLAESPSGSLDYVESLRKFGFVEFNTLAHRMMRWNMNVTRDSTADKVRYDWQKTDDDIKRFHEAGINITCNFHIAEGGYGPPKWALVPNETNADNYYEMRGRNTGWVKISKRLWLEYVNAFVTRYRGKFSKYVVQDEPSYYFHTPEQYARFYLDTRQAIKTADPDARVFFNAFCYNKKFLDALKSVTDGKPENYVDGIHAYLSSMHAGAVSANAEIEFRNWLKAHKIPLVTPTCFSCANRLVGEPDVNGSPRSLADRAGEYKSIHFFYDGIVWGGARCHYFYYGVMPGEDKNMYLFDSTGQIKPIFNYFSAANRLIGNFISVKSIDSYPNFRIGLFDMGGKRWIAIIYSVDGRLYDFSLPGKAMDSFGNPLSSAYCGPYPTFIELNNPDEIKSISLREKISFETNFIVGQNGLELLLTLKCAENPLASTFFLSANRSSRIFIDAKPLEGGKYQFKIPLYEKPGIAFSRTMIVPIATRWGDVYPELKLEYNGK